MGGYKSWDEIRGSLPLNEEHVTQYGRLSAIEDQLYALARHRGVSDRELAETLGVPEDDVWPIEPGDELFVFALARHVAALGGHLELRAVFDDESVLLLREPEAPKPA